MHYTLVNVDAYLIYISHYSFVASFLRCVFPFHSFKAKIRFFLKTDSFFNLVYVTRVVKLECTSVGVNRPPPQHLKNVLN